MDLRLRVELKAAIWTSNDGFSFWKSSSDARVHLHQDIVPPFSGNISSSAPFPAPWPSRSPGTFAAQSTIEGRIEFSQQDVRVPSELVSILPCCPLSD